MWEKITSTYPSTAVATARVCQADKDRKRKAQKEVKEHHKRAKRDRQANNSKMDYSRYDGVPNATEETTDLSPQNLYDLMDLAEVIVTEARSQEIACNTSGQGALSNSRQLWLDERRKRITSSNSGKIAKRRTTTEVTATITQLLYSKFEGNPSTEWGINQEAATNLQYLEKFLLI